MRLLELYCGTQSVGRVAEELGWEVVSVDIEKKSTSDFDETAYARDHFDLVWASVWNREREIVGALSRVVQRTREIVKYYEAGCRVIENPVGMLDQTLLTDLARYREKARYCKYGRI